MTATVPHPKYGPQAPTERIGSVPSFFFIPHQYCVFQIQEDSEQNTLHSYKHDK